MPHLYVGAKVRVFNMRATLLAESCKNHSNIHGQQTQTAWLCEFDKNPAQHIIRLKPQDNPPGICPGHDRIINSDRNITIKPDKWYQWCFESAISWHFNTGRYYEWINEEIIVKANKPAQ